MLKKCRQKINRSIAKLIKFPSRMSDNALKQLHCISDYKKKLKAVEKISTSISGDLKISKSYLRKPLKLIQCLLQLHKGSELYNKWKLQTLPSFILTGLSISALGKQENQTYNLIRCCFRAKVCHERTHFYFLLGSIRDPSQVQKI